MPRREGWRGDLLRSWAELGENFPTYHTGGLSESYWQFRWGHLSDPLGPLEDALTSDQPLFPVVRLRGRLARRWCWAISSCIGLQQVSFLPLSMVCTRCKTEMMQTSTLVFLLGKRVQMFLLGLSKDFHTTGWEDLLTGLCSLIDAVWWWGPFQMFGGRALSRCFPAPCTLPIEVFSPVPLLEGVHMFRRSLQKRLWWLWCPGLMDGEGCSARSPCHGARMIQSHYFPTV